MRKEAKQKLGIRGKKKENYSSDEVVASLSHHAHMHIHIQNDMTELLNSSHSVHACLSKKPMMTSL